MKDLVLVAINAKYIHTNLAVRYLKAQLCGYDVGIIEVSINDSIHRMAEHCLASSCLIFGFSCYIWSMELVLKVAEILKKSRPEAKILLGGPEVSFDPEELLTAHGFIDFIITGEGETSLEMLLESKNDPKAFKDIPGLWFITMDCGIAHGPSEQTMDLEKLNFPYSQDELLRLKDKIIYYETMRGCPYHCSYCLSSTGQGVRTKALEQVFKDLDFFMAGGMKQVKLVDRTFNFDTNRAKAIFNHLIEADGKTNFHFEMTGDQLDDELVDLLKKAQPGLIQFEIGVQSTDITTLKAIGRQTNLSQLEVNVKKILDENNIHIHLDLIAGLPYETYAVFKTSFNRIIALKPDMLQLGFLKCLKGTRIRREGEAHHYYYMSFPPYEIISNAYISSSELYRLRNIEILVDRYFNSGGFKQSLSYLFEMNFFKSAFDFFEQFSDYWSNQGYYDMGKSKEQLYEILLDFIKNFDDEGILEESVKFDYLCLGTGHLPHFFKNTSPEKEWIFDFLKDADNVLKYCPDFKTLAPKKIYTQVKIQRFSSSLISTVFGQISDDHQISYLVIFYQGKSLPIQ